MALEKQAEKVVILNIKKLSSVSDYLLVCSAGSERQVQAIADAIEDGLRKDGERPLGREGVTEGRWALIDFNDVVAHIFLEPVRVFYDLEGLWAEAPVTEVKDKPRAKAPKAGAAKARAPKARAPKAAASKARASKAKTPKAKAPRAAKPKTPRKKKGEG